MPLESATALVSAIAVYVAMGFLLLPWWHARGLRRLDTTAAEGPWGFRVLISPGLVALWPWLLARARRGNGRPAAELNAHRRRAEADSIS
jgi:hypothetical protein